MLVTKQLLVTTDFHSLEKKKKSQLLAVAAWLPAFFKLSSSVEDRRKKLI